MANQVIRDFKNIIIFMIVVIILIIVFFGYKSMFNDMTLRINERSYFSDDKTEDLVVELFTKQDVKHNSYTKETKRIIFSTSRYSTEKEGDTIVNYILNYVSNVGGSINDISTEKISSGGLIIFRPTDRIIKTIDIEVPKDAPFAESLENTLYKFMNNEKYTMERYNKRHGEIL